MLPSVEDIKKTYKLIPRNFEERVSPRKWFKNKPFYVNLAYLIGKATGYVHISKSFGHVMFSDHDKVTLNKLKYFIIQNFRVEEYKFHIWKTEAWGVGYAMYVSDALLTRLLHSAGAPKGKKVETKFSVPLWFYKDEEYIRNYLIGIFEDELTTIKIAKKSHSIKPQFKMAKCTRLLESHWRFMEQIRNSLMFFNIECGKINKIRSNKAAKTWDLYFAIQRNKRNILKFEKNLGFKFDIDRLKKLKHCCKILKNTLGPEINREKLIFFRKRGLSIRQIAGKTGISRSHVHRLLQKYKKEGIF